MKTKKQKNSRKQYTGGRRRRFIKLLLGGFTTLGLILSPLAAGIRLVWAEARKIILPRGTRAETLTGRNPANLDTRHLELTPLEKFRTMGLTNHRVDLKRWRLEIDGRVQNPARLTYSQVLELQPIQRDVLLICPGFFAYHARWKGVSVADLLKMAGGLKPDVTHVSFSGPQGNNEKSESFPIDDILSGKVFLAYRVNDRKLPRKHGFPLRVVAEGYYGGDWVKYVYKITADKS